MSEPQDNSSLPILLTISAAVLLTVVAGWYLLDDDFSVTTGVPGPAADNSTVAAPNGSAESELIEPVAGDEQRAESAVEALVEEAKIEPAAARLDANLRKARMAAEADLLAYPAGQSALFYYDQILEIDPDHAIARAELETVLGKIAHTVSAHMAAKEYADAHALAVLVARRHPGHELVQEVAQELDRLTGEYVEQAMQYAQDGNEDEVTTALAAAEELPGRNPEYFSALRESIDSIQNSRITAEQNRKERARLANVQASTAWVEKVRSAIVAGRLVAPAGDSAVEYLAERDSPKDQKEELTKELIDALMAECAAKISLGGLNEAERLLIAATELVGDTPDIQALRNDLESAFVATESAKFLALAEFVRLNVVPARYPSSASRRNLTGWVEIAFTVTSSGETADIEVRHADPAKVFNNAAIKAVEQWKFEPRVFRGQTISQRTGAKLVFDIQ
ncbi:MAG: energy transducer TonB [Gammaproteobacteria bacterium]|nr:energy transducer TonB [Gammaproteobacteria bacterium]